jgi:hypothetical protein
MEYSDANGIYRFYDLEEGKYSAIAEKFGPDEPDGYDVGTGPGQKPHKLRYSPGGYFRSIMKTFSISEKAKKVTLIDKETGKRTYDTEGGSHVRLDFELEPIGESEYRATVKSKFKGMTKQEKNRLNDMMKAYNEYDPAQLENMLNAHAASGDPNAIAIRDGFNSASRQRDPERHEWLRERLLNHEIRKLQKGAGGRWSVGDVRRTYKAHQDKFGFADVFNKGSYKDPGTITQRVVKAGVSMVLGMMLAAVGGNAFIFFGALLIGLSNLLPNPTDLDSVMRHLENVKDFYNKKTETAISEEEKKMFQMELANEIALTRTKLDAIVTTKGFDSLGGIVLVKELFHVFGFAIISAGFLLSSVPFAKPIGIIIALMGYFSLTYQTEKDEGDGTHAKLGSLVWRKRASV